MPQRPVLSGIASKKPFGPFSAHPTRHRFGLFRVRSPLLTESLLFSFPLATEMFHFARSSLHDYVFIMQYPAPLFAPFTAQKVVLDGFPHSDILGSKVAWDLPGAYRTLQRPSSGDNVKASTVCSYLRTAKTHNCASPRGSAKRNFTWHF